MKVIFARKIGMTTIYGDDGIAKNVTLLESGKNVVTQIRNEEKDGYAAIQYGIEGKKQGKHMMKREVRADKKELENFKSGQELGVDQFQRDDLVTVIGVTKGKGFQGVVKRHGFAGSPATHGHRHDLRAPGSIGSAFPERVLKGKKMAGRMGSDQKTIKGIKVVEVDAEKNLIAVKGPVPGSRGKLVQVIGINE